MNKELLFAIISTGIYLIGIIPYWRDVLKWRTYPHPFTTGVWTVLVGFNSYILYVNEEYYSFIPSLLMTISLVVFWIGFWIYSFRKIKINWFDYFCLILSILLLFYWFISQDVFNTVILTLIVDLIAFLPVFKKGWLQPWTETVFAYFMAWINQIFTFLALAIPNPETSLFWIYLLISNIIFCIVVLYRRWSLKWWKSLFE